MSSNFFEAGGSLNDLRKNANKKRKLPQQDNKNIKKLKSKNDKEEEENDEEDGDAFDLDESEESSESEEEEEEEETAAEKRLRLAKQFLSTIKKDDETLDDDQISKRLEDEAVCDITK